MRTFHMVIMLGSAVLIGCGLYYVASGLTFGIKASRGNVTARCVMGCSLIGIGIIQLLRWHHTLGFSLHMLFVFAFIAAVFIDRATRAAK